MANVFSCDSDAVIRSDTAYLQRPKYTMGSNIKGLAYFIFVSRCMPLL